MSKFLLTFTAFVVSGTLWAQQAPSASTPAKPAAPKSAPGATASGTRFCSKEGGFCLTYPASWKKLGDFEGAGIVIAKPTQGLAEDTWPQVTATAVDLPETPQGKEPTSFDDVVNVALDSLDAASEKQTLSRASLTLGGLPAQRAKVQYKDAQGKMWVEDVVFMDGDDVVYSVALRCRPEDLGPLLPVYEQMLRSWKEE